MGDVIDMEWIDLLKLLAAVLAGALIGLEREMHGKTAGFRTNVMICLGAALFTIMSVRLAATGKIADPGRIAAQIVTGVGFLGAGAILQMRRYVVGMTTAATIWAVASLGMAFGAGAFVLGSTGTLLTAGVLFGLGFAEKRLEQWRTVGRFETEMDLDVNAHEVVERLCSEHNVECRSLKLSKTPEHLLVRTKIIGPKDGVNAFHSGLLHERGIRTLKR